MRKYNFDFNVLWEVWEIYWLRQIPSIRWDKQIIAALDNDLRQKRMLTNKIAYPGLS